MNGFQDDDAEPRKGASPDQRPVEPAGAETEPASADVAADTRPADGSSPAEVDAGTAGDPEADFEQETPARRHAPAAEGARVRFQGVIEAPVIDEGEPGALTTAGLRPPGGASRNRRDWDKIGAQLEWASQFLAVFVAAMVFLGLPLGTAIAHYFAIGSLDGWSVWIGLTPWSIALGFLVPMCFLMLGFTAARMSTMVTAAEQIAEAAHQISQPDQNAVFNIQSVGAVVRTQVDAINAGIDDALLRLASVEAMIRQHVEAIETAGTAIETRATGALDRVVTERTRLIKLTEQLNSQADDFAVAIAEKAQASIDSFTSANDMAGEAEKRLEERLVRLEGSADRALASFQALREALSSADEHIGAAAASIQEKSSAAKDASDRAARIAEAAAETAARNAANVGQFSRRAGEEAKKAADGAIETARAESERVAAAAVEHATAQTGRVADAVVKAVEGVKTATDQAVRTASSDAEKAVAAAEEIAKAAHRASEAASVASETVRKTGENAASTVEAALQQAEAAKTRANARNKELAAARSALESENERLESLIEEQRQRADRLADAIAAQTERLSRLAEAQLREQEKMTRIATSGPATPETGGEGTAQSHRAREEAPAPSASREPVRLRQPARLRDAEERKSGAIASRDDGSGGGAHAEQSDRRKDEVSWREILTATDDARPLNAADRGARKNGARPAPNEQELRAVKVINRLQNFTVNLERRLYGEPPTSLLDRFERGDRNVFANRLLRLNEADIKRRIRMEINRDKPFEKALHDFLQGFEGLLEEATTSETADEELEQYLSSPLGRVYLLIGATVGYFA